MTDIVVNEKIPQYVVTDEKQNHNILWLKSDKIRISQAVKCGYIEMDNGGVADLSYPSSKLRRGRVQGKGHISPAITTGGNAIYKINRKELSNRMSREELIDQYRIRKLTPRECWRLMGFLDEDFDKASEVNSKTQLYKQAGNSIVVNVLMAIFGQLFSGKEKMYAELA